MIVRIGLFIVYFIVWLLIGLSFSLQHVLAGIPAAVAVAFITGDLFCHSANYGIKFTASRQDVFNPVRYFWFACYAVLFFWEYLKSVFYISLRSVGFNKQVNPGIIKVRTTLISDTALSFLANTMTLSTDMLCVDLKPKEGVLYVYCVDAKDNEDFRKQMQDKADRIESILKRIFE